MAETIELDQQIAGADHPLYRDLYPALGPSFNAIARATG
jgi:hypothetical protein